MNSNIHTVKEILRLASIADKPEEKLWIYLGDFLDYFYNKDISEDIKYSLVEDEPDIPERLPEYVPSFAAAMVEKICIGYSVKVPNWVFDKKYVLKKPYFSLNARNELRLVLLAESPREFRARNLFVSANTLDRV